MSTSRQLLTHNSSQPQLHKHCSHWGDKKANPAARSDRPGLRFKPSGHFCLLKSPPVVSGEVFSPSPMSLLHPEQNSVVDLQPECSTGGLAGDVLPPWEGQERRARLKCPPTPAFARASLPSSCLPRTEEAEQMLQHFLLFLWLSNRLPLCHITNRAWEEHLGPGGKKEPSWERDLENWEEKGGLGTGQSG